jgi:hypothetical protein
MPLIPQQDILTVTTSGFNQFDYIHQLKAMLESYPPCRIVSISITKNYASGFQVIAVIETI